jgi:hypothetical protein
MLPFLQEGDGLVVRQVDWQDIRLGDVVTYRFADKFPTRRVVRKIDGTLVLWCENWPARRFRAAQRDVLGRVVARERNGSWLKRRDPAWRRATRQALIKFYGAALVKKALRIGSKAKRKISAIRNRAQKNASSSPSSPSS